MFKHLKKSPFKIKTTNFIKQDKKFFNGLFERPTQSLCSHLQILGLIEINKNLHSNFNLSWTFSIIITSSLIRLIQIPTYYLVKDLTIEKCLPKRTNTFINKWSHRLVYNDFYIDMKRNKKDEYDKKLYLQNYDKNVLLSYIPQLFLLVNNFRALYSMSKAKLEDLEQLKNLYPGFNNDLVIFGQNFSINLATHDAYFILPVIVFINNYLLLKISDHPWLINYTQNGGNKMKLVYLSFCMALFSVYWPKCYCISWISYCLTHIIIKLCRNFYHNRNKKKSLYQFYVEREYKGIIKKYFTK